MYLGDELSYIALVMVDGFVSVIAFNQSFELQVTTSVTYNDSSLHMAHLLFQVPTIQLMVDDDYGTIAIPPEWNITIPSSFIWLGGLPEEFTTPQSVPHTSFRGCIFDFAYSGNHSDNPQLLDPAFSLSNW